MGAKELIVTIEQMLTQAKSLEPKDTADAFALIQENANDFVALVREQRKTREENEPSAPPTVLEIYIAYAAVSKFKSLPEKDKIQRACGYLGIKEQEFSLPKIEYKYAPLYDAWNAAKVRPLASHNLAEQERGFALNEFGTLLNQGLSDSKTAEFNVARKKRLALLGLNLADDRGASHFFDQGIPLSTSVLSIKRPADIENWFRECNERSAPTESSLDDKINSQIEQNLFNQFERDVIPHLGTPKQEEAIRSFLQGRSDRFSKTGYTGAPYSLINRFCVGLALTLIDPADPTPNKALWNIVLPEVQGVHGNGNSTDWPAYGEVLLDDNLVNKQPGQLWSYPLLLSISQSVPCFGVLHGKPASDFERMSPSEQWIMESLKDEMPSTEVLKRVYLFNEKHSDFWSAQQLTLQPQRATPNLLEFFQDLNQLFAKYQSGNAGAGEVDIGNEGNDAALPFQMTCAVLLSTTAYSNMFRNTGLQEIMSNIVNPGNKYKDTRSCFMQNHGKLSAVLRNPTHREILATWDNIAADFLLAPANNSLAGIDTLSHDATQLLYQQASTLSREELTDAINQQQPNSEDLPVLFRAFDERVLQQEDKNKVTFLFNFIFQLNETKSGQLLRIYCADDCKKLNDLLLTSHTLDDYALILKLLNNNSQRERTRPITELLLSQLNDPTYQWEPATHHEVGRLLREMEFSPNNVAVMLALGKNLVSYMEGSIERLSDFLKKGSVDEVAQFALNCANESGVLFKNKLHGLLSQLPIEHRVAFLHGLGPHINDVITNVDELISILSLLPREECGSFLSNVNKLSEYMQDDVVFEKINDILTEVQPLIKRYNQLISLDSEAFEQRLAELGPQVLVFIDDIPQRFIDVVRCLSLDKRLAFILSLGEEGKELALKSFSSMVYDLNVTALAGLIEFIGTKLSQIEWDFDNIYSTLCRLPENKRYQVFNEFFSTFEIKNADNLETIINQFSDDEKSQFLEGFGRTKLFTLIQSGSDFAAVLRCHPVDQRKELFTQFGLDNVIALLTDEGKLLSIMMALSPEHQIEFIDQLHAANKLQKLIISSSFITIITKNVSEQTSMHLISKVDLAMLVRDSFPTALYRASASMRDFYCMTLGEKLRSVIPMISDLKHVVEQFDVAAPLPAALQQRISELITNPEQLGQALKYLNHAKWRHYDNIIGSMLPKLNTAQGLADALIQLPPEIRQSFLSYLGSRIDFMTDASTLVKFFEIIPEERRKEMLILFFPQIKSSNELAQILLLLPPYIDHHDYYADSYDTIKLQFPAYAADDYENDNSREYLARAYSQLIEMLMEEPTLPWTESDQDWEYILKILQREDAGYFINMLNLNGGSFGKIIHSNDNLITLVDFKSDVERFPFISSLGTEKLGTLIQNNTHLISLLEKLPVSQRHDLVLYLGSRVKDLVTDTGELIALLSTVFSPLTPEQKIAQASLLTPVIDDLIQTPEQLVQVLTSVSLDQMYLFSDKMTRMLVDASVLQTTLEQLPPSLYCCVLSVAGGQQFDLIRNAEDLIHVLSQLDEENQSILMRQLGNSVLIHANNINDFVTILRYLKDGVKREFLSGTAKEMCSQFMTDLNARLHIGEQYPEDWKASLVSDCAMLINKGSDLNRVLALVNDRTQIYSALVQIGSEKLNSLQWSIYDLTRVLDYLPPNKIQNFIQLLDPSILNQLFTSKSQSSDSTYMSPFRYLLDFDQFNAFITAIAPLSEGQLLRSFHQNMLNSENDNSMLPRKWLVAYYMQATRMEGDPMILSLDNFAQLFQTDIGYDRRRDGLVDYYHSNIREKIRSLAQDSDPLSDLRQYLIEQLNSLASNMECRISVAYGEAGAALVRLIFHSIVKIDAILAHQKQLASQTTEAVSEHITKQQQIKSSVRNLKDDGAGADNDIASARP